MKHQIRNTILICLIVFLLILLFILFLLENREKPNKKESFENSNPFQYTAVIVEPRKHPAMEFVLKNFTQNLDSRWSFLVFHGNSNKEYVENIIQTTIPEESYRIKLIPIGKDNLTIDDYNVLFYDREFYDKISTEIFLIFQTDSMICSPQKNSIYDYLKYDYVGAPWPKDNPEGNAVGNGGLSLRRKSKMLEKLQVCKDKLKNSNGKFINEDVFFANRFNDLVKINKPTVEDAKNFSMEAIFTDKPFGVHKPWDYLSPEQNSQIESNCPGYNELVKNN